MKIVEYNEYLLSTIGTDGLVLYHLNISSHSAQYAPLRFQLSMGNMETVGMAVKSPRSSEAYIRQSTRPYLIQKMTGRQYIIWHKSGSLLTGPMRTHFNEISTKTQHNSIKKIDFVVCKMAPI